jgi:alpha-glucosidase (family GH31 glycosyl hydrolase)
VFDPTLKPDAEAVIYKEDAGDVLTLRSSELRVYVTKQSPIQLTVDNLDGSLLFSQEDLLARASEQAADIVHRTGDNLYGMKGLDLWNTSAGLLRNGGSEIDAGAQGDGGAPFFFTTRFGVLFDTIGGAFDMRDNIVEFSGGSRQDIEYFAVSGTPLEVLSQFAKLSGRPPMPPKWTLGFLNSQWGSDEKEVRAIVDTYRSKHIPLDAFILDYDWKAWGEDNYGEWRWNSTAGTGNHDPAKFPGGSNGLFAEELRAKGVKLAGILKPRIFVNKPGSTTERDDAAGYATDHHLWYARSTILISRSPKPARGSGSTFCHRSRRAWLAGGMTRQIAPPRLADRSFISIICSLCTWAAHSTTASVVPPTYGFGH